MWSDAMSGFSRELFNLRERCDQWSSAVIDQLLSIDQSRIDQERSTFVTDSDFFRITLVSVDDRSCPFSCWIGHDTELHRIFVLVGDDDTERQVTLLSYVDISARDGLEDVCQTLSSLLKSSVLMHDRFAMGKLVRREVRVSSIVFGDGDQIPLRRSFGRSLFARQQESLAKEFEPWIPVEPRVGS